MPFLKEEKNVYYPVSIEFSPCSIYLHIFRYNLFLLAQNSIGSVPSPFWFVSSKYKNIYYVYLSGLLKDKMRE
jgi:hypothetical protein